MKNILSFICGGAIGAAVTWKILDEHYKNIANEEIESVIERFNKRKEEIENKDKNNDEYHTILKNAEYMTNDDIQPETTSNETTDDNNERKNKKGKNKKDQIYVIDIDDFGAIDEYATKTWMQYADGVLADEFDNVVETPSMFLGEALTSMNDEDDSIYVRNDILKCDYEVIKSEKSYGD